MDRQEMQADIVVAGFGPASAGFLLTLAPELAKFKEDGTPLLESAAMPGMPLQVMCYERADDPGFGVSGIVTKGTAMYRSHIPLQKWFVAIYLVANDKRGVSAWSLARELQVKWESAYYLLQRGQLHRDFRTCLSVIIVLVLQRPSRLLSGRSATWITMRSSTRKMWIWLQAAQAMHPQTYPSPNTTLETTSYTKKAGPRLPVLSRAGTLTRTTNGASGCITSLTGRYLNTTSWGTTRHTNNDF